MCRRSLVGLAAGFILSRALATAADNPSDPQSPPIAHTASDLDIDIKIAQLALDEPEDDRARGFAGDMMRYHEAVNEQ